MNSVSTLGSTEKLDVVFIPGSTKKGIDSSFNKQKDFILKFLEQQKISREDVLPGVVTYRAESVINIGDITDMENAKTNILSIKNPLNIDVSPSDDLLIALRKVQNNVFKTSNGARHDATKSVIIFMDNKDQINDEVKKEIKLIEDSDVKVLIIAIGPKIAVDDIKDITTNPNAVSKVKTPKELPDIINFIGHGIKTGKFLNILLKSGVLSTVFKFD